MALPSADNGFCRLPFPTKPVPRLMMTDPKAFEYVKREEPVILTDVSLTKPLVGKWTVDYLCKHFSEQMPFTVFTSKSQIFKYWDNTKNEAGYTFTPPTQKTDMSFRAFVEALRREGGGGEGESAADDTRTDASTASDEAGTAGRWQVYLQQALVTGMGDQILEDFKEVDWEAIYAWKHALALGELTTNLLLIGSKGHTTPAHYDEQHNFFSQLVGRKQVILFGPADWDKLYPYPLHHACDRQSQVEIFTKPMWPGAGGALPAAHASSTSSSSPAPSERNIPPSFSSSADASMETPYAANAGADADKYPLFGRATAFEAVVGPGEMLYIPSYWWHHISSLEETVSLTFWFKCGPPKQVALPITAMQKVALRRNIETQMAACTGGGRGVRQLLLAVQQGNVTEKQYAALEQIRVLLRHVLPEDEIQPFLLELANGRFHLPLEE